MSKRMRWTGLCLAIALWLGGPSIASFLANAADSSPNAARIRRGTFKYRDMEQGKQEGSSTLTIRRVAGSENLKFVDKAEFGEGFSGFHSQTWEAVTSADFHPIRARLALVRGDEVAPIFDIRYQSGRATGFVVVRKDAGEDRRQEVDASVPGGIVDQRIDWAAILASELKPGGEIGFSVFDPVTGISRVTAEVGPPKELRVPAGTFSAFQVDYHIQKPRGSEHYRLFVSATLPHIMVREDFPNGVVSELVYLSGSAPQN